MKHTRGRRTRTLTGTAGAHGRQSRGDATEPCLARQPRPQKPRLEVILSEPGDQHSLKFFGVFHAGEMCGVPKRATARPRNGLEQVLILRKRRGDTKLPDRDERGQFEVDDTIHRGRGKVLRHRRSPTHPVLQPGLGRMCIAFFFPPTNLLLT